MKLKNMLMMTFLALTIIPIIIVSVLLYKSGIDLSKESYTLNLVESLNVQADYISQSIENNMISDFRFAMQTIFSKQTAADTQSEWKSQLHSDITSYLSTAGDKIAVCILLDKQHASLYSIGEKVLVDTVTTQIPLPSNSRKQNIIEFDFGDGSHSLGIVTPVWDNDTYAGCLISVYEKSYIFKIISSYYEIADTSTYICRGNGDIINSRQLSDENIDIFQNELHQLSFSDEDSISTNADGQTQWGYYKSIHNTPWYLVGFIDGDLIYSFANQFLLVYIIIILGVLIVDIILSFYFSRKVVKPINNLIKVMEGYKNNLDGKELQYHEEGGYVETKYLRTKFLDLMKNIVLTQHNFEGVYRLYQSNDMGDINIDIDVTNQTISSNKNTFQDLINTVKVSSTACVVEKFTHCFCEKDAEFLMGTLESMRDEHLSVTQEVEVYTPYMDEKWFHAVIVPVYTNERLSRLFVQLRDISSFKKQELESTEQAKRDALTGLYNRAGFFSCVNQAMHSKSKTDLHALLFMDIDYFKLVNDNFGHTTGDDLLRSVGKILFDTVQSNGIVSRFGGDEFAVFLTNTTPEAITEVENTLNELLVFPFKSDNISFVVSVSIGISIWRNNSQNTLDQLLQQADDAMYKSKRAYKQNNQI